MRRMMKAPRCARSPKSSSGNSNYMGAAETRKFMEQDYARLKQVMAVLGLVK